MTGSVAPSSNQEVSDRIAAAARRCRDAGDDLEGLARALIQVPVADVHAALHGATGAADGAVVADLPVLVSGLAASPGVGVGRLALSVERALEHADRGEPVVLAVDETGPADEPALRVAAGVVTVRGGMASHAAVVARGLGVPAVCGAESLRVADGAVLAAGWRVAEGEWLTVDGHAGVVRVGGDGNAVSARPQDEPEGDLAAVLEAADRVAGGRPAVLANADNGPDARLARRLGAAGVGLCRTEHLFLGERLPLLQEVLLDGSPAALVELEARQREDLGDLLAAMDGRPVTIRLLDAPLHEFLPRPGDPGIHPDLEVLARSWREHDPMLGARGVRLGLLRPELYRLQIRAVLGAAGDREAAGGNPRPRLLVPMVSWPEELAVVAAWVEEERVAAGARALRVGAMVETPAAALSAGPLASLTDHLSIGSNDLTQLVLGLGRDDAEARLLDPYRRAGVVTVSPFERLDERVLDLIGRTVAAARSARSEVEVGLCGEQGADEVSVARCRALGVDSVSCSPYRVPVARLAAGRAEAADLLGGPA